ncbi:MAG TPA: hypothetical protein VLG36_00635 [Candidatus Chromulinivoraceae bacterium]|nr:hypothetical protein [Candidatus Chromulinivoraceae bacterium]
MTKYIFIYKVNEAYDLSTLPEPEVKKMLELWDAFFESLGSAVVDKGQQFKFGGKSVSQSGVKDADNLLVGFSIIEAKDFDGALEKAKNVPSVLGGQGTVEIYEAFGA